MQRWSTALVVLWCALGLASVSALGGLDGAIRLGSVGPLSGPAAAYGMAARNGLILAVDEANAQGGVLGRRVKLVFEDDRGEPAEGAKACARLVQEAKVAAIIGPLLPQVALAGAAIAQAARVPLLTPTATDPKITAIGDYIFRTCLGDAAQGALGARFAYQNLAARSAAAVFDRGDAYTVALAGGFRDAFASLGGRIPAFEAHASGLNDFGEQLRRVLQAKPDLVYIPDGHGEAAIIASQLRALGYGGPLLGGDGWDSPELAALAGLAIDGGYFTAHYAQDDSRPAAMAWAERYRAAYGMAPDAVASLAYEAVQLVLAAIQAAGSADGPRLRDALATGAFDVVSGRVRFDAGRNPLKPAALLRMQAGRSAYYTTVLP